MARDVWMVGLVYDPYAGHFYGVTNGFAARNLQELFRIDASNGIETLIGPTGSNPQELQSLVIDASQRLLASGTRLYELNRQSGAATAAGTLSFPSTVYAMANRSPECPAQATLTPSPPASATSTRPGSTPTRTPTRPRSPTPTPTRRVSVTTSAGISATERTVRVDDTRSLPPRGTLQIDLEIIRYDGIQVIRGGGSIPGILLNLERGVDGTVAADHAAGSTMILLSEPCAGDCNGDGEVAVNELIVMVNIALGNSGLDSCRDGDVNHDGEIAINELVAAVNKALAGCLAM